MQRKNSVLQYSVLVWIKCVYIRNMIMAIKIPSPNHLASCNKMYNRTRVACAQISAQFALSFETHHIHRRNRHNRQRFLYVENSLYFNFVDFPVNFIKQFVSCFFWSLKQMLLSKFVPYYLPRPHHKYLECMVN